MNIYKVILVCPCRRNVRVCSEMTYRSQTKLIGQSLPIEEHGIGYSNLAFATNRGQNWPVFSFKPLKGLGMLEIQS